ncbi:hypothetical protein [Paraherbaspirillum soli]|uniref:Proline-rich protein n=1 Tax=Paraherbaspirillum soli TaxID=631222 RepID=A0ABW0M728_9BURK
MIIFDKTDLGRDQIKTRDQALAPRLRTLLLLVDGKTSDDELLKKVAGLGLGPEHLDELRQAGLIQVSADRSNTAAMPASPSSNAPPPPSSEPVLPPGQTQFEAIYHFYNDTIKNMIGLRGYSLQLKVERASSIEDFRELRQAYLEAVHKAKGDEIARSMRGRLDQLLFLGEKTPSSSTQR